MTRRLVAALDLERRPAGTRRSPLYGLVGAYFVSGLGTAMSAVAIPWLVLVMTGSAAETGVVGFAQMAPYVALQATAGPVVERLGLRRAFLLGNTVAALAMGAVPVLHETGGLNVGVLAALMAVAGAVRGIADAATTPMIPATAEAGRVPIERATGSYSAANRTALLVGMPLAGVLIAATGAVSVVLIDGVSFLAAVAILGAFVPADITKSERPSEPLKLRSYVAELAEGMRFLRADRLLLSIVAMVAITNLLDEALTSVLLPVWAHDRVHRAEALGFVGGALGLGMLGGVLVGAWLGPRLPRWATFAVGTLVSASPPFFALAAWTSLPPVLSVALACGIAGGVLIHLGTVQFERVPPRLHARVLGAIKASAWLGIPFGSLLGGTLAQSLGLTTALVTCGSLMLLASLAPFVFPVWRGLERPSPAKGDAPTAARSLGS